MERGKVKKKGKGKELEKEKIREKGKEKEKKEVEKGKIKDKEKEKGKEKGKEEKSKSKEEEKRKEGETEKEKEQFKGEEKDNSVMANPLLEPPEKNNHILVLGLDGAGKTSVLHSLALNRVQHSKAPTQGFNAVRINTEDSQMEFLEMVVKGS
uniref:ADP ribosylation factor like GTPase 9 n=1 Tax=Molossus molossus TaxID=27622 RepID=A0A7J8JRF6_MOLMO|nr:ADP ribosylation factor like GTPase 9 [Molossus molossus]